MSKILTIAAREFLETVRTRAFFLTVVVMPLIIMLAMFGADRIGKFAEQEQLPVRKIAVIDDTGKLFDALVTLVDKFNKENPKRVFKLLDERSTDPAALTTQVESGALYAYLRIPAEVITGDVPVELARKDRQLRAGQALQGFVNTAVHDARFEAAGVDLELVRKLQRPVGVMAIDLKTGQAGNENQLVSLVTPFAAMFLLFMGIVQISYGLLTSVLEEKSSRVIEVLLAAVSPMQLMAGKIVGMVLVGLLLLAVWSTVGYSAAAMNNMSGAISFKLLAFAGIYFLPGFLLYSALLAAIGSACNTLKEAQSLASPVTIINLIPMMLWFPISQSPHSAFSVVLSFIPPITPFVMILRVCADPNIPAWQVIGSQVVLWAAVGAAVWAAGKVFRIGILMYGKPPTPRELLRWVRYA